MLTMCQPLNETKGDAKMAITFNITPPVTAQDIRQAVDFLGTIGTTCGGMTLEEEIEIHDNRTYPAHIEIKEEYPEPTEYAIDPPPSVFETLAKSSTGRMIPWDERIHSGNKTVLKDGSWKLKRGIDMDLVRDIEAELEIPGVAEPAGIQSESASEATPPPGAVEALNAIKSIAPPPPPAAEVRYKHGDQTFTKADLLAAKWSEEQIAQLETVEVSQSAPATPTNFAEVATRIHAEGLDVPGVVDPKIAEIAAGLGKPNVNQLALCAAPANADVLAGLAAALWPSA